MNNPMMFLATDDFRLYNNAFILRRRVRFEDGFPTEEPKIAFKFRHPDQQQAAAVDVRPDLPGDYRIKLPPGRSAGTQCHDEGDRRKCAGS